MKHFNLIGRIFPALASRSRAFALTASLALAAAAGSPPLAAQVNIETINSGQSYRITTPYLYFSINQRGTLGAIGNTKPGIQFSPDGTSTFASNADFLTPGSPHEGFAVSVSGAGLFANNNAGGASITGGLTHTLSGTNLLVTWSGANAYFDITNSYSLTHTSQSIPITTTLTAKQDLAGVQFVRTLDPDQDSPVGSTATTNTLGYGSTIPASDIALAAGSRRPEWLIGLFSNSSVTHQAGISRGWSTNPAHYLGSTPLNDGNGDYVIGMGFDLGRMTLGQSTSFTYSYVFGASAASFEEQLEEVGGGGGSVPNIDTAASSYAASGLGSTVNPAFEGGTLRADATSVSNDFTVTNAGGTIQAQDGVGATFSGVISDASGQSGGLTFTSGSGSGTITLSGANTYTGATQISAGTVNLTGSLASTSVTVAAGATLDNVNGGLAAGATLTNAGTVNLGADETIAAFVGTGALNGTGRTLTANTYALNDGAVINANLGTGTVTSTGAVALNGTSAAATVTVASGTLSLGAAERLADDVALSLTGNLALGGSETIGRLTGAGAVALDAHTLTVASGSYAGVASGTGGLTKTGTGDLTLSGANTYTGATQISGGTVNLTGALASTAVTVAAGATLDNVNGGLAAGATLTNAGTVNLGADETIAAFVGTGALNGTGRTLTAATYALNDGAVINANLGTGTVTSTGAVALNGTSAAATVTVASGTLSLGAAERLADSVALSLTGNLALGGNETIGSLTGAGAVALDAHTFTVGSGSYAGVASGTGGLTKTGAGELTLSGANTYTGATQISAGTVNLTGSLASASVNVAAGATLDNVNGGLAAGATLTNAGTVNLGADETITAFVSTGTLNGTGRTLTANTYALNDASVINANLGTGTVTSTGAVALNGTSAAATVTVASGTLSLGAAERLADDAVVAVAAGASLQLNGQESVDRFVSAGRLFGQAGDTLTARLYDLRDGAVIDANLGRGTLVSNGSVLLNGESAADEVLVQTGALTLGGPDRLADYAWVDIRKDATLVLANGNDIVRLLTGEGSVELRNGSVLTVHSGVYAGTAYSTGALLKDQTLSLTLAGENTYEKGTVVRRGELDISEAGRLTSEVLVEENGLLRVNGQVQGGVVVERGGLLQGAGRIGQQVVNTGLTSPGNSPGMLRVEGNYYEHNRLLIEIDGRAGAGVAGGHDQLSVGGKVILHPGSTLELNRSATNGFEPGFGDRFLVVNAAGAIEGRYSFLDRRAFTTQLLFDHSTGYVYGTGVAEGADLGGAGRGGSGSVLLGGIFAGAVTPDDSGQLSFFDSRSAAGALVQLIFSVPSLDGFLDAMSPVAYVSLTDYALHATRNHVRNAHSGATLAVQPGWRVSGGYSYLKSGTQTHDGFAYEFVSRGGTVAVERDVMKRATVGAFVTIDEGIIEATRLRHEAAGLAAGLTLAVRSRQPELWVLEAGAAWAEYDFEGGRSAYLGNRRAKTQATARDAWSEMKIELLRHKYVTLGSKAGLAYTASVVEAFREDSGLDAFAMARSKDDALVGELGVEAVGSPARRLRISASATLLHNFHGTRRTVAGELLNGSPIMSVSARGFDKEAVRLGAGVGYKLRNGLAVDVIADAVIASGSTAARSLNVRMGWSF